MEMACVAAAISCSCRARICRAGPGSGWRRRPTLRSRKAPRLRALLSEISCGWSSPGSYRTILALQWYRDSAWGQDRRAPWRHPSSCTFRDNPVAVACRAKLVRIINAVDRAQRLAPAHRLHASRILPARIGGAGQHRCILCRPLARALPGRNPRRGEPPSFRRCRCRSFCPRRPDARSRPKLLWPFWRDSARAEFRHHVRPDGRRHRHGVYPVRRSVWARIRPHRSTAESLPVALS